MLLKPVPHRIREIYDFPAEVDPRQAVVAFEVLDHVVVIRSVADLRDAEELDQFLFCHDGGTGRDVWESAVALHVVHGVLLAVSCQRSAETAEDLRRRGTKWSSQESRLCALKKP